MLNQTATPRGAGATRMTALNSSDVVATKGPRVMGVGRKCTHKGCSATLSRYNAGDECFHHRRSLKHLK